MLSNFDFQGLRFSDADFKIETLLSELDSYKIRLQNVKNRPKFYKIRFKIVNFYFFFSIAKFCVIRFAYEIGVSAIVSPDELKNFKI